MGREAQSPAVLSCHGGGGRSAGTGFGHEVAPAAPQRPAASSPLQRARHSPALCPCSHVALRPQSSGTGRQNHPGDGRLPEGRGRGTLAAPVARSSRGAAAAAGRRRARSPSPPLAPASCPLRCAPARPSRLAQQRTHSLRGRLQGYPRGGGWGRLRPLASSAAFLSPWPFRRSMETRIQTPKQKKGSKVRGGKSS